MAKKEIIGDGSLAAIKAHTLGREHVPGGEMPSSDFHRHVAPTNRAMEHHDRVGPIYSNSPAVSQPRGQQDHPVEGHPIGPGSMDKPLKSGPAWGAAERILRENRAQHAPGKPQTAQVGRKRVVTY
jgi:hypothetical protein